jgi:hypothetical protein
MKIHLYRSERSTWCGRAIVPLRKVTRSRVEATCKTCLKADEAEQRKETM